MREPRNSARMEEIAHIQLSLSRVGENRRGKNRVGKHQLVGWVKTL
jgi:hypothetical protein